MTTMTKRMAPFCGTVALLAQIFVFQGCGGSNSGTTGTGGAPPTGPGTGGTTTSTGGTPGTGGTTTSTGGTPGTAGASGFGQPACGNTMAGAAAGKGVTCTAADVQVCYKTCGPEKTGVKPETCSGGAYSEGDCAFNPTGAYSCYAVPAAADATCPATAPMASSPCMIADCVVCGGPSAASAAGTGYLDSTGAAKTGYCVCQAGAASPTWSCASTTAWPCPNGSGC